jgi:EAL domain-containing protein (putative c-di-GMP-specific phosphodiesterase class I)
MILQDKRPFKAIQHINTTIRFFLDNRQKIVEESEKHRDLKRIIENQWINTYYQPIVSMKTNEIFGYETLNRPMITDAFKTTEQFYDFVGRSPNMFEMETICRQLAIKGFYDKKNKKNQNKMLFINVHPRVMLDPSFRSGKTIELLKNYQLRPEQIILEVTEKGAVSDYLDFMNIVHHYREQGFRIAVDDAGSGYNSLKTLVFLQPEFIKIDRAIIDGVSRNHVQQEMVGLLFDYAKRVKTQVIAEGIETLADFQFLQKMGIDYGQGYFISKPNQSLSSELFQ